MPVRTAIVATNKRSLRHDTSSPNMANANKSAAAVQLETAWKRTVASKSRGEKTSALVTAKIAVSRRFSAGVRAAQTSQNIAYRTPAATPIPRGRVADSTSARRR
jgi:hypothetical protein